jgi:membrane protease YdiL (CAAX protease family)
MDHVKRVLNWVLVKFVLQALIFVGLMVLLQKAYFVVVPSHAGPVDFGGTFAPLPRAIAAIGFVFLSYFAAVGIVERRFRLPELSLSKIVQEGIVGSGVAFLGLSLVIGIMFVMDSYNVTGTAEDFGFFFVFAWVFRYAIFEEIIFRGIFYRIFEARFGTVVALLISSVPFGIAHLDNAHASWLSTGSIILGGLWLGILYTWSGYRLWVPIFGHVAWNYGQVLYGVPVSGFQVSGYLESEVSGSDLITGGHFGPEASLLTVALLVVIFTAFYVSTQKKGLIVPFKLKGDPWVSAQDEDTVETT